MKKAILPLLLTLLITAVSCGDDEEKLAPLIVKTIPTANQKDVDPSLKEIEITFYDYIEITGSDAFSLNAVPVEVILNNDSKGFIVNVNLEPGKEYKFVMPGGEIKTKGSNLYMDPYTLTFYTAK